ncbi:MAG: protein-L-isoaspartate(D-aspartate) O-methyltransferase [Bradymonadales bacterium]|jgi:protein-L-isoaspartate(D-aspartate) O-methyltransferase
MLKNLIIVLGALMLSACASKETLVEIPRAQEDSVEMRQARIVERQALVDRIRTQGVKDEAVLNAILSVPREDFVTQPARHRAYEDRSLPAGYEQSTLRPSLLAAIIEGLRLEPSDSVLEIGTGSGYMTVLLSRLARKVYSIEILEPLGQLAAYNIEQGGYSDIELKVGDGYEGWEEKAPFDAIVVSCAPDGVPKPLVEQLKEGGRVVIPVGTQTSTTLYFMHKENGVLVEDARKDVLIPKMQKPLKLDAIEDESTNN